MKKTANNATACLPAALQEGDTIGLVMPAGPLTSNESLTEGIKFLLANGFKVKHDNRQTTKAHYLAGSDRERAEEFHRLWQDQEVKAIMAVRGGYGCLRLLPYLDLALIRSTPKLFVGFSDITALLNTFALQAGLVCLHGPMLTTLDRSDQESIASFFMAFAAPGRLNFSAPEMKILIPGQAQGRLLGGNLTTLCHLLATPYEIDWQDAILFLEDVGEAPYRIDRMLTQIKLAGRLEMVGGIILGSFSDPAGKEIDGIETIWQRVCELTEEKIPVWANFPSGHGTANLTLPVGMVVKMDSTSGRLESF